MPREAHEIARFAASRGLVRELLGVIRDDDEERLGVPDRPGRRVVRRRRSLRIGLAARRRRRRRLERRDEAPFLFDCETDEELSTTPRAQLAGPPQVATDEYRRGWDAIWGARERSTAVN